MATTDFDFKLTRQEIIKSAFEKIGVSTPGQTLSGTDEVKGALVLNTIIKDWRNQGIFLWKHNEYTFDTIINQPDYTLGNNVMSLDLVRYVDTATSGEETETALTIITYEEYLQIYDKESKTNKPTHCALDYTLDAPKMYLYPTPNEVKTIRYLATDRMKDMDTINGYPEVPAEYLRTLITDLAAELSADYGLPLKERDWLEGKTERLMTKAKQRTIERPDSVIIPSAFPNRRS